MGMQVLKYLAHRLNLAILFLCHLYIRQIYSWQLSTLVRIVGNVGVPDQTVV